MAKQIGIAAITIIVIVALIVCFVPFIECQEKAPRDYKVLDAYFTECGSTYYVPPSPSYPEMPSLTGGHYNCAAAFRVIVENTDTEIGSYTVEFNLTDKNCWGGVVGTHTIKKIDAIIAPGKNATFQKRAYLSTTFKDKWSYKVIPDTKTIYERVTLLQYIISKISQK